MDFAALRRLVIQAVFADEVLMDRLVLKGGSALALIHQIGGRSSIDVDLSMHEDLGIEELQRRLLTSLTDRFDAMGLDVFDFTVVPKPGNPEGRPPTWGGYEVSFKLLERTKRAKLRGRDPRGRSLVVAPGQQRIFRIEISRFEYTAAKEDAEVDGYPIYVYPPSMIAVEKLRAICQQMPEYQMVRNKRARARDFYDIHCVVIERGVDLGGASCHELAEHVFAAKEVPLRLIQQIPEHREFHRPDWPSVEAAVAGALAGDYDFYFDWVVAESRKLEPLWEK